MFACFHPWECVCITRVTDPNITLHMSSRQSIVHLTSIHRGVCNPRHLDQKIAALVRQRGCRYLDCRLVLQLHTDCVVHRFEVWQSSGAMAGRGRGMDNVLPAWMTRE